VEPPAAQRIRQNRHRLNCPQAGGAENRNSLYWRHLRNPSRSRRPVKDGADFTNWPEMLGRRVKTPASQSARGLLYRRHNPDDLSRRKNTVFRRSIGGREPLSLRSHRCEGISSARRADREYDIGGPQWALRRQEFRKRHSRHGPGDYGAHRQGARNQGDNYTRHPAGPRAKSFRPHSRDERRDHDESRAAPAPGRTAEVQQKRGSHRASLSCPSPQAGIALRRKSAQAAALYIPAGHPATDSQLRTAQGKELSYNN